MPHAASPWPRIGAHTSIAGALAHAAEQALSYGCSTFQIFSRSPRKWRAAPLDPAQIEQLAQVRAEHDLNPMVIHGNYLMNLAAADGVVRSRSIEAFRDEVERALALGAEYLVIHPGSSKGHTPSKALRVLADSVAAAVRGIRWNGLELLLENTAGGGQTIGRDFAELAELRDLILRKAAVPVGFCLDTAHCFAAGFNVSTSKGLKETLALADRSLNLAAVKVIHANDSKTPLGSRVDRHEHIGKGGIGQAAFRRIVNHPKLRDKVFILETPHDKRGGHRRNVRALRALADAR